MVHGSGLRVVEIDELIQTPIVQARAGLDPERVAFYVQAFDQAHPVTVFDTGEGLLLVDGYHRVEAARRLGRSTVQADVRQGSRADAMRYAVTLALRRGFTREEVLRAIARHSTSSRPADG